MRRPEARLRSWILVSLALQAWPVAADFRDDYKRGIEELERGQASQAGTLFRQAIAARPDEKARLSVSPSSKRYLPHFFLGEALLAMGDCEGALVAWAESEQQGVITRLPEYQSLIDGREICRDREKARAEAEREAEVEIANAEAAAIRVDRLRMELGQQWANAGPELRAKYDEAKQRLIASRAQLIVAVAARNVDGMRQAAILGRQARELLEAVEGDASQRQAQLRLQQGALIPEVEQLIETVETELRATESLRPYPPRLGRVVAEIAALIDANRRAAAARDLGSLRGLRAELEDGLARLREAAAPPPTALIEAADAFFDGRYEAVLEALEGFGTASRRIAIQTHILRSAANFSLFHLGGSDSDGLLQSAREEAADCLQIDSDRRPPAAPFSPRFVEFFETEAAAAADEPFVEEGPENPASN